MVSIALSDLRTRLRIYLNDVNSKTWADDDDLNLFINHAIVKFTSDLPIRSYATYTVADDHVGDEHTFELPADFVNDQFIRGYFGSTVKQENIFRLNVKPGAWVDNYEPKAYIIDWPGDGYFYIPRLSLGPVFTLYYGAYHSDWLTEDTDTFNLGRNRWGEQAVLAYSAFLAFNPSSARRAQLEQWARRGDQNVGNPLEEESQRWLQLYNSLLAQHASNTDTWEFISADG